MTPAHPAAAADLTSRPLPAERERGTVPTNRLQRGVSAAFILLITALFYAS